MAAERVVTVEMRKAAEKAATAEAQKASERAATAEMQRVAETTVIVEAQRAAERSVTAEMQRLAASAGAQVAENALTDTVITRPPELQSKSKMVVWAKKDLLFTDRWVTISSGIVTCFCNSRKLEKTCLLLKKGKDLKL